MVHSAVSWHSWEFKEGQWAFYRPGPYDWVHPKRPRGKCVCEVYRLEKDLSNEEYIGAVIMDLADYPFKRSLWIDKGIYIRLFDRYYIDIDFRRSINMVGYDENVFFWSE